MNPKVIFGIFVFIFLAPPTNAQKVDAVMNEYFKLLKNLKYDSAIGWAENIPNPLLKNEVLELTDILYHTDEHSYGYFLIDDSTSSYPYFISHLKMGYQVHNNDPYNGRSFYHFNQALRIADNIQDGEAKKLALRSILNLYDNAFLQTNKDLLYYLDLHKDLESDAADRFHSKRLTVLFHFRNMFRESSIDKEYMNDFEELLGEFPRQHHFWKIFYSLKGTFMEVMGEWSRAARYHKMVFDAIDEEPYLKYLKFRACIRLSVDYTNLSRYDTAENYINQSRNYIDKSDTIREKFYIEYYLSQVLKEKGDYEEAFTHLESGIELKNLLDYQRNSYEIANLNRKYQTQEKEIALLKEREKVKTQQYYLIIAIGVVIFLGSVFYLNRKSLKRKQLIAIQERNIQKQELSNVLKEQELSTIDAMISGQEKERQRIASDLHDDLGGLMATIKLHFESLKANVNDRKTIGMYEKTNDLLGEAYTKIRNMAHAKNSGMLASEGLLNSVKELAKKSSSAYGLKIHVNDFGLNNRLENSLELSLFRIIQELVTNIIKHAQATEATIHLTNHEDSLNIMVEDNGVGFKTDNLTNSREGMGIKSIDKRIDFLNGTMEIDSEPGSGTNVIINVPLS